jgi:HK97 family phage prohead protease
MLRKTKSFKMKLKSVEESGVFEGYASTYDLDLGGDIIRKGAFARTLSHNQNHVILWQHDPTKPIGAGLEAYEDDKGLFVKGQLCMEVQQAREARALMAQGALKGLSIGYETKQDEIDEETGHRIISEIKLYEYSPVSFPMNESAGITAVKQSFKTALEDLLNSIRSVQGNSNQLPPECIEVANKALSELKVILRNDSTRGNSSSGTLPSAPSNVGPDQEAVDPLTHSIEQLRQTIRGSMSGRAKN